MKFLKAEYNGKSKIVVCTHDHPSYSVYDLNGIAERCKKLFEIEDDFVSKSLLVDRAKFELPDGTFVRIFYAEDFDFILNNSIRIYTSFEEKDSKDRRVTTMASYLIPNIDLKQPHAFIVDDVIGFINEFYYESDRFLECKTVKKEFVYENLSYDGEMIFLKDGQHTIMINLKNQFKKIAKNEK